MKNKQVDNDDILLGGFLLVFAFAGIVYYFLDAQGLETTAVLFIGIAAVLAVGLSLLPTLGTKSVTGTIVMGTSLALILSMFVFHEGLVCILMATPLFLSFAVSIGLAIDKAKNKNRMRVWLVLILLPLSLEGVTDELSFNRHETVTVSKVVALSPDRVEQKLTDMPDLSKTLPVFLQLGFPAAHNYSGEDLTIGSERCFHVPPRKNLSGDVCWVVEERSANHVVFRLVKDESKIAHWMTWRTARVDWLPTDEDQTQVVVTLKFWRELDPSWYFSPLERYAVGLTGDYLIGAYFEEGE